MKAFLRLLVGWTLMLAGVLAMLDANVPASRARSRAGLAVQAVAGFAVLLAGWWLRKRVLRRRESDD